MTFRLNHPWQKLSNILHATLKRLQNTRKPTYNKLNHNSMKAYTEQVRHVFYLNLCVCLCTWVIVSLCLSFISSVLTAGRQRNAFWRFRVFIFSHMSSTIMWFCFINICVGLYFFSWFSLKEWKWNVTTCPIGGVHCNITMWVWQLKMLSHLIQKIQFKPKYFLNKIQLLTFSYKVMAFFNN